MQEHNLKDKLKNLNLTSINEIKHKVKVTDFAPIPSIDKGYSEFLDLLPNILAGKDFKKLIQRIREVKKEKKFIGVALGGHVVKCGLSSVIIDMMERDIFDFVAVSGATAIHDYEISLKGETSEDVEQSIKDGNFGMCRETGEFFARAIKFALKNNFTFAKSIGLLIQNENNKHRQISILAQAVRLGKQSSVHIALGTDTIHLHPDVQWSELAECCYKDFLTLVDFIKKLEGGIWINIGSAVILPEVFLKAVSCVRNLGFSLKNTLAVNFDMIKHYRSYENVVRRPFEGGLNFIGHHEIMLPLLRIAVLSQM